MYLTPSSTTTALSATSYARAPAIPFSSSSPSSQGISMGVSQRSSVGFYNTTSLHSTRSPDTQEQYYTGPSPLPPLPPLAPDFHALYHYPLRPYNRLHPHSPYHYKKGKQVPPGKPGGIPPAPQGIADGSCNVHRYNIVRILTPSLLTNPATGAALHVPTGDEETDQRKREEIARARLDGIYLSLAESSLYKEYIDLRLAPSKQKIGVQIAAHVLACTEPDLQLFDENWVALEIVKNYLNNRGAKARVSLEIPYLLHLVTSALTVALSSQADLAKPSKPLRPCAAPASTVSSSFCPRLLHRADASHQQTGATSDTRALINGTPAAFSATSSDPLGLMVSSTSCLSPEPLIDALTLAQAATAPRPRPANATLYSTAAASRLAERPLPMDAQRQRQLRDSQDQQARARVRGAQPAPRVPRPLQSPEEFEQDRLARAAAAQVKAREKQNLRRWIDYAVQGKSPLDHHTKIRILLASIVAREGSIKSTVDYLGKMGEEEAIRTNLPSFPHGLASPDGGIATPALGTGIDDGLPPLPPLPSLEEPSPSVDEPSPGIDTAGILASAREDDIPVYSEGAIDPAIALPTPSHPLLPQPRALPATTPAAAQLSTFHDRTPARSISDLSNIDPAGLGSLGNDADSSAPPAELRRGKRVGKKRARDADDGPEIGDENVVVPQSHVTRSGRERKSIQRPGFQYY